MKQSNSQKFNSLNFIKSKFQNYIIVSIFRQTVVTYWSQGSRRSSDTGGIW
jgi:hypothetical protein